MITKEQINLLKDVIVETMHPKRIYLFGSYATGNNNENSDVDFLVEVESSDLPKRKRPLEVYKKISNARFADTDILVRTTEEIEYFKSIENSFLATIIRESKIVYAQ
jgi:uncharacterized protein